MTDTDNDVDNLATRIDQRIRAINTKADLAGVVKENVRRIMQHKSDGKLALAIQEMASAMVSSLGGGAQRALDETEDYSFVAAVLGAIRSLDEPRPSFQER